MGAKSQIVIRSEVDHLLAIKCANGRLLVVQYPELEVRASILQFIELIGEIRKRISASSGGCHGWSLSTRMHRDGKPFSLILLAPSLPAHHGKRASMLVF